MNIVAHAALLGWPLVVVVLFNTLRPRKAAVYSFVIAWLFLPNGGYALSGLPDYTKMTATVASVLLFGLVFDSARFFAFRPRLFDLPMLCWCLGAFVSAVSNGLTLYDGFSLSVTEVTNWGLPYFLGRVYLTDEDALRDLAEAMLVGGLCYVPLCLLEIRFSPFVQTLAYGWASWEGVRYGGYRPKVFMATGLALGIWMANASLLSFVLWSTGSIKAIRGVSFGLITLAITVTSLLCKATGASFLMLVGMAVFWIAKKYKVALVVYLLVAIPPLYCVTRTFNLWSGRVVVDVASATVGEDRAQSFEYRLNMEEMLVAKAMERPLLGWSGFSRFMVQDATTGKLISVPDGLWVIALGIQGLFGLSSLVAMFLLPMTLTLRRFPVRTWEDPRVAPMAGLALILTTTMIDFLSNAMIMPIYPLAIGGFLGPMAYRAVSGRREAEEALSLAAVLAGDGQVIEAGHEFRRAIELTSSEEGDEARTIQAEALDGLAYSSLAAGRLDEAEAAFREALVLRDALAASSPDDERFRDLAIARDGLSRALAESGKIAEAIEERRIALQIWEILEANHPRVLEYRDRRVNTLNDLAWLLATDPGPTPQDPSQALALAEESVRISPDHDALWNTLGVARYRAGDWAGAIEALERSAGSSQDGAGTAFDHYFLAMAWCRLQHADHAEEWLERGIAWAARHRAGHPALERFRREAETLLQGERNLVDGA